MPISSWTTRRRRFCTSSPHRMTNPSNNQKALATKAPETGELNPKVLWGGPLTFAMVGAMVAVVVWFYGEVFGQATRDARISVLVWLPLVVLLFSLAYMVAIFFGLDKAMGACSPPMKRTPSRPGSPATTRGSMTCATSCAASWAGGGAIGCPG